MSKPYDMIIVGAGISGLSMAYYCVKKGLKTLVLEKDERVGGCMYSHRFTGEPSGFWIELGAHTGFNSYGNLLGILEDCHLLDRLTKREKLSFKLRVDRTLKPIASQLNFPELFFSLPRLFTQKKAGQSVAAYYAKIVGRRNFAKVFSPAFDAVICQPAAAFPAEMLFRAKPRRKDVMRSFTLPDGLQTIAETLSKQPGVDVLSGQDVRSIAFANGAFTLTTASDTRYEGAYLCVATPACVAAPLLRGSFPDLAERLERIRVVTVETVGVALCKDTVNLPRLAGIIASNDSFFSMVSRDTVNHAAYRGFTFHFKPGLLDHDGKLKCIREVLGVPSRPLEWVTTATNRLPAPVVGHARLVSEIDKQLAGKPFALTGNYFTGVSLEDSVSRSLSEFSRLQSQQA